VHAAKATDDGPICVGGGGSGRQPGSSFKPFTLAKAFEKGLSPESAYSGPASYTFPGCHGNGCTVHNVEERGGFGQISLRQATWHSVNTVYAQLVRDVGVKDTAELAHRVGLTMVNPDGRQPSGEPYGPSLTLGAAEVSPLDMAAAYSVFAARGMQAPVTPVLKVVDSQGTVLEDHTARKPRRVLAEEVADNVTDVLRGVIASGTGRRADIGRPAAGKTGTSEDYGDAWFIGYTPVLSTSVWMGYSDTRSHSLVNIKGVPRVYGGTIPAQTWHDFMSEALKNVPPTDFNQPAPILPVADQLARVARGGFDPGDPRPVLGTPPTSVPLLAPPPVGAPNGDQGYIPYQDLPTTTAPNVPDYTATPTTRPPFRLFGGGTPPTTVP
jgi:penicillin-binding protein 1A